MTSNAQAVSNTTSAALTATGAAQLLEWLASGAHAPMPESVALLLGAAVVALAHAGYLVLARKLDIPSAETAPTP